MAPGANTAQYRTFAWAARPAAPQSPAEQTLRASLEQNLAQKGLTPAAIGQPPDFLVDYHAKTQERIDVNPTYYGWWGYSDINTYTEGTIIVDFIDPNTQKIFWRGTASAVVDHPNNPDPNKIDHAVSKLIQQYPTQMAQVPRQPM
jgi:hypothetical protein